MRKNLWDGWTLSDKIGEGEFGEVYKALKVVDGVTLSCAVKYVSLPKNQQELDKLVKRGVVNSVSEANSYYLRVIDDLKKEIAIMQKFNGSPYIIDCFEYIQENKYDGNGIDFYIRMELAEDIEKYFGNKKVTQKDVINLGIDICSALELCSSLNIIHKDIKPSNIYMGSDGKYKLGDFGIAGLNSTNEELIVGTYNYISPEVYNKQQINYSTDLYSLGIVMYKLLNDNKLPFSTRFSSDKDILKTRMSGVDVLPIKGVDKGLMDVIVKACKYSSVDRYISASDMKKALQKLSGNIPDEPEKVVKTTEKTLSIYDMSLIGNSEKASSGVNFKKEKADLKNEKKINNVKKSNLDNNSFKEKINKFFSKTSNKKKISRIFIIVIVIILLILILKSCVSSTKKCDVGYVNKNGSCVEGYYYCDEGYTLNEDNKCQKSVESIEAKVNMSCDGDGYILNGGKCVKNDTKEAKVGYQCASGFTLKGNKCTKVQQAAPNVSYACSSGYTLIGDSCMKVVNQAPKVSYSCSKGTLSGKTCTYTESNSNYIVTTSSCPSGYEYSELMKKCCKRWPGTYTPYGCVDQTVNRKCSQGSFNGNTCIITKTEAATEKYSCNSGYQLVSVQNQYQCVSSEKKSPNVKKYCSSGYTLSGNVCVATVSVDAVKGYTCDNGYIFTGSACVANSEKAPKKDYSCSKKYTLNGDKCEKYDIKDAKISSKE